MYYAKTAIVSSFLACGSRSREPNFLVFPDIDRLSKAWSEKYCLAEQQYFGFLLGQFEAANLSVFNNNWSSIFDFTPAAGETTWILLPEVCERALLCKVWVVPNFSERKFTKIQTKIEIHVRARNWEITQREGSADSHVFARVFCKLIEISHYPPRVFAVSVPVPRASSVFNMAGCRI